MSAHAISEGMHGVIGGISGIGQQLLIASHQARQQADADSQLAHVQARADHLARTVVELRRQLAARDTDIVALENEAYELTRENRALLVKLGLA